LRRWPRSNPKTYSALKQRLQFLRRGVTPCRCHIAAQCLGIEFGHIDVNPQQCTGDHRREYVRIDLTQHPHLVFGQAHDPPGWLAAIEREGLFADVEPMAVTVDDLYRAGQGERGPLHKGVFGRLWVASGRHGDLYYGQSAIPQPVALTGLAPRP
jgi:hypothetical protein